MPTHPHTALLALCLGVGLIAGGSAGADSRIKNPMISTPSWEVIRDDITETDAFLDGEELLILDAPEVAADGAFVPFSIRQRRGSTEKITRMSIVIDENPAPLAANFELGALMGEIYVESRVRIYRNTGTNAEPQFDKFEYLQAGGGIAAIPNT